MANQCNVCKKCIVDFHNVCVECWWENSNVSNDSQYCDSNRMTLGQAKYNYSVFGIIKKHLSGTKKNHIQKNPECIKDYINKSDFKLNIFKGNRNKLNDCL